MIDGLKHAIKVTSTVASNYDSLAIRRALQDLARELRRQLHHAELKTVGSTAVSHKLKGIEHDYINEIRTGADQHQTRKRKL